MASLNKALKSAVSDPIKENLGMVVAQITFYDNTTNRADLKYDDPSSGGVVTLEGVPVEIPSLGVASAGPFPGDQVYVSFLNNNPTLPRIIGRADGDYKYYSRELYEHGRSGSQLTYGDITNGLINSFTNTPVPSFNKWLSVTKNAAKVIAMNVFSASAFEDQASELTNYELAEVGMTHPGTASTMKLYNNGVIDVFASTDLGMRVSPSEEALMCNSTTELHNATDCSFMLSSSMGISAGSGCTIQATSINETSSDHTIVTEIFAAAANTRCDLSGGLGVFSFQTLKMMAYKESTIGLIGATVSMSGPRLSAKMDEVGVSGTSYGATFEEYEITSGTFSLTADTQNEKFGDYGLDAKKMKVKAGTFNQDVNGAMKVTVDGAYSLTTETSKLSASDKISISAPTCSMTGDKNCKFQYGRFDVTTLTEGVLFNVATRFNATSKTGMTFKTDGAFDVNTTSKLSINAKGLGTISTNGLEVASAKTMKFSTLGGALSFTSSSSMTLKTTTSLNLTVGSSVTANATSAMTFTAPSLTYKASTGLSLSGDTTRITGTSLYLTGANTYLNATNTSVGGEFDVKGNATTVNLTVSGTFKANIDGLVRTFLTNNKTEVLRILGLDNVSGTASSAAESVFNSNFDRKFTEAHRKAHAND